MPGAARHRCGAGRPIPTRPVTLVVPFPAGGSTDLVARVIAEKMTQELGQQIVVENRGGAGGNLGSAGVAKADPDGYTILMGTVATHALNPAHLQEDALRCGRRLRADLAAGDVPNVLVVNTTSRPRTSQELIALLKAKPGKYSYASSGNGTPLHLSGELFKTMAGVDMVHVPYKGAGPALIDLMGGHVPIMFDNLPSSTGLHQGRPSARARGDHGRARALDAGPADDRRIGPARLRDLHLERPVRPGRHAAGGDRAAECRGGRGACADPEVQAKLQGFGATVVGSSPTELAAHVQAELAKWAPVVEASGAQID